MKLFINAYLQMSKGAKPVSLNVFRMLPSSRAAGAQQIGRLTNLMQLSVDTTWFTVTGARSEEPDLGDKFPHAVLSLAVGEHQAIPRTDDDVQPESRVSQTVFLISRRPLPARRAFHSPTIEQGGIESAPSACPRGENVESAADCAEHRRRGNRTLPNRQG